ncbi:MAG: hypothetical protein QOJ96_205 [Alphaproteobacteria bacterium]|jgi:hypothetical protein|nr:hypothetical protein [Alphaproteobacteria bacterium]
MSTVIRTEKRQRSAFGQIVKWIFIAFNVLMLVWLVSAMSAVSQLTPDSDAARAGHAIGAAIGFSMVLSIWVMGDLILGLFVLLTRGNKIIVEETAGGYRGGDGNSAQEPSMDADAAIARYVKRQQAETTQARAVPSLATVQGGFGRRLQ